MNPAALFTLLAHTKQQDISTKQKIVWAVWGAGASFLLLLLLLFIAPQVWLALALGDWTSYTLFGAILPYLLGVLGVVALIITAVYLLYRQRNGSSDTIARATRALLTALAAPDDATLPPLPAQPAPLTADPALQRRTRLTGLQKLETAPLTLTPWLMAQQIGNGVLLMGIIGVQIGLRDILNALAVSPEQQRANSDLLLQILGIWIFVFLGLSALNLAVVFNMMRRAIWADRAGLAWPRFSRRVTLPWHTVTAIGAYTQSDRNGGAGVRTYVIAAGERIVTWRDDPAQFVGAYDAASRLLRLAATQTGLPVRDLTPLAGALAAPAAARQSAPVAAPELAARAGELLAAVPGKNLARQRRRGYIMGVALVVILVAPILATRYIHDIAQPAYLATLPAKIHAETPLFSDGLRAQDDLWPVKQPTADDYEGYAYTPQGYTLTGSAATHEVFALMPETFTSVAIQVTATENGAIPPHTYDGVGIILRGNPDPYDPHDDNNYCTFSVNYAGNWAFYCEGGFYTATGHSAAIHTGPGAMNTLLAIARGNQYIGYVNGQYVGQIFDQYGDLGAQGQIGVVNVESGMQATFTDFTVWPVNPPPDLNYV